MTDELGPKCLDLRVGRLLAFTEVPFTHTQTHTHGQTG